MYKRILMFILILTLLLGVIPAVSAAETDDELTQVGAEAELAEEAADVDAAETGGLSLAQLMAKFPEGKYWNHKLLKQPSSWWETDSNNDPDKWTDHPCYDHGYDVPVGEYTCNEFDWGIQCFGFAAKISYDAYGSSFYDWNLCPVKDCKPGDVITYTHISPYSGSVTSHTFMVIGREKDLLRIGECNFDCHCMITWSRTQYVSYYLTASADAICYSAPYALTSYSTDTATVLSNPVLGGVKTSDKGLTVSWKSVNGAAGYRVYYKGGSQTSWKAVANTASTSWTFTNAVYNTTYTFTVRALDENGKVASGYDGKGVSGTFKFAPKVTAVASASKITVGWTAVANAAKYRVYIKGGQYSKYTALVDVDKLTYAYTAGTPGEAYTFAIRPYNAKKEFISDSGTAAATFIVGTPSVTKLDNTTTGIRLTWDAVKGAPKYRVFIKSDTGWKKLCDTTSTTYTYTSIVSGQSYTFTVRCISADGKKFVSNYQPSGWTAKYIGVPRIASATSTANGVKLRWNAVPGAAKYRVFIKNGTSWKKLYDTTGLIYTHTAAVSGTSYTYTIRCISADGTAYTSAYDSTGKTITYKK